MSWTMCWNEPNGSDRWDVFDDADSVANELIGIAKRESDHCGNNVPVSELDVIIFRSDADTIDINDVECYCSDKWVAENSLSQGVKDKAATILKEIEEMAEMV